MIGQYPATSAVAHNSVDYFYKNTQRTTSTMTEPTVIGQQYQQQVVYSSPGLHHCFPATATPSPPSNPSSSSRGSMEKAVSEALLTLSSARPAPKKSFKTGSTQVETFASPKPAVTMYAATPPAGQHHQQQQTPQTNGVPSTSFSTPLGTQPHYYYQHQHGTWQFLQPASFGTPAVSVPPRQHQHTPKQQETATSTSHPRPGMAKEDVPAPKKARTVSPPPAVECQDSPKASSTVSTTVSASASTSGTKGLTNKIPIANSIESTHGSALGNDTNGISDSVSCICPVCNRQIKGLGDHKVDWSQPVQGRQRAKTITGIKKHVNDFHPLQPIWNVIVNSLDVTPTAATSSSSSSVASNNSSSPQQNRVVTAQAFVTQALKKAALDQIPTTEEELRSARWTEKMIDQRVGIAKGFIQFGGQEYLRNKECQDEIGQKINPKSLRNLAYSLLQGMYDDLMEAWTKNESTIEAAMATEPLGLLRNRFQLLFAAPDKWNESWYMDPSKYAIDN